MVQVPVTQFETNITLRWQKVSTLSTSLPSPVAGEIRGGGGGGGGGVGARGLSDPSTLASESLYTTTLPVVKHQK